MNTYFSTFIPGLGAVIKNQLEKQLENFNLELLLDGLIVYSSDSDIEKIKSLKFLNNSFIKLDPQDKIPVKLGQTFRVVFSKENELVKVNNERLTKIENKIAKLNNLKIDRANPDFEFWFFKRSEGHKFTGVRITKHPDYKTILAKGQLRQKLADILCLLSNPQKFDVVLDPFAGSGAIGVARENYSYTNIISEDLKTGFDATNMVKISDQSIDKIITDPPWGISMGLNLNLPDFYHKMLSEFYRVLTPNGLAVILMGNKEVFKNALDRFSKFKLEKQYNILVSGKKAAVYKLTIN